MVKADLAHQALMAVDALHQLSPDPQAVVDQIVGKAAQLDRRIDLADRRADIRIAAAALEARCRPGGETPNRDQPEAEAVVGRFNSELFDSACQVEVEQGPEVRVAGTRISRPDLRADPDSHPQFFPVPCLCGNVLRLCGGGNGQRSGGEKGCDDLHDRGATTLPRLCCTVQLAERQRRHRSCCASRAPAALPKGEEAPALAQVERFPGVGGANA
jgi:hypothetical protein